MALGHAAERVVAFDVEATFASGIGDWSALSADGAVLEVTEVDTAGLQQGVVPNKNIKQRVTATRGAIPALKSEAAASIKTYMYGSTANAAANAQAVSIPLATLLKNALGGLSRGYAAGLAGGTSAAPEVDAGQGANLNDYDWGFFYDTSAAKGYFRQIKSISTDTLTMSDGHTLPFTPDAGGADEMHACMVAYIDRDALVDHTHANHTTLTFYFKGDLSDSTYECKGCKVSLTIDEISAGNPGEIGFSIQVTTFANEDLSAPAFAQTPSGTVASVVGSGTDTLVYIANADALLAEVDFYSVAPNVGIAHTKVTGPNGTEGVHGYTGSGWDETGATVRVPYSDDYAAEFRAQTRKHLLIQVGTSPTKSWAIYFPNLAYAANPSRSADFDLESSTLELTALEGNDSTSGLSAGEVERMKSKIQIIMVA